MRTLTADKRLSVLHHLVEGNSIRSTERLLHVHRDTIMRLLVEAGNAANAFLDERIRGLRLRHVEVDEIWTFVEIKQGHLPPERADDPAIGDQYTFVAIDQDTKLIPSHLVGTRTGANCEAFMLDLSARIKRPRPGEPPIRMQISSDAFAAYPGAVDLAFADTVDYGIIIKSYEEAEGEQVGRYAPPDVIATERRPMTEGLDPWSICTSHAERNNLSMRTFLRRMTRLSLGFSKKLENLIAAVSLHMAYYNFCWKHGTLHVTPAMAAGLTGELWRLDRLVREMGS